MLFKEFDKNLRLKLKLLVISTNTNSFSVSRCNTSLSQGVDLFVLISHNVHIFLGTSSL